MARLIPQKQIQLDTQNVFNEDVTFLSEINVSGDSILSNISASGFIYAPNIGTGEDNSVVILDSDGRLKTDEIDSRVWGSALVDGSGTAGQVSYWSDGNTITGESDLFWDATNNRLGIGTNTPNTTLDVNGDIRIASQGTRKLSIIAETAGDTILEFTPNTTGGTGGNINVNHSTFPFIVKLNNNEKFRITNSGDVGIGTTSPSEKLTIEGNISASGNINVNGGINANTLNTGQGDNELYAMNQAVQTTDSVTFSGLTVNGTSNVDGDLTVTGKITAQEFHTEFVSASIIYQSGSTKFGDTSDDNHNFTGSVNVTNTLFVNGNIISSGSLFLPLVGATLEIYNTIIEDDGGAVTVNTKETPELALVSSVIKLGNSLGNYPIILSGSNVGIGTTSPSQPLTVEGNISSSGDVYIDGGIYDNNDTLGTPDQVLFTTSTGIEWRDNIAQEAQDLVITGKNLSGGTIAKGTPLYFTGSGTQGNVIGIYPADAGNPNRMPAGGVAGEQIADDEEGSVYIYGFIVGVDTSQFNAGDDVFVGVGGGYTNQKPTGSALIQKLGNVERVSSNNGSGVIQGPSWYNDLPNWEGGKVKVGRDDGQPVTSSVIHLDEVSRRLGIGTNLPSQPLTVEGNISGSGDLTIEGSVVINTNLNILHSITSSNSIVQNELIANTGSIGGFNINASSIKSKIFYLDVFDDITNDSGTSYDTEHLTETYIKLNTGFVSSLSAGKESTLYGYVDDNLIIHTSGKIDSRNINVTGDISGSGDLTISGTLSKGAGSFKIKHPNPQKSDKTLWHSFVESPTAGDNIYRWQIEVVSGSHSIELPDYYKYLNENHQIWISPIKHFGQGWGEVNEDETFVEVTTNQDGIYNVLLIGTRKDEIAKNAWKGIERNT